MLFPVEGDFGVGKFIQGKIVGFLGKKGKIKAEEGVLFPDGQGVGAGGRFIHDQGEAASQG